MSQISRENAKDAALILRAGQFIISDEDTKEIRQYTDPKELAAEIIENGPPFSPREVAILEEVIGDIDSDHNFRRDGHMWRDDILDKYAEHIQNYHYTYNQEALKVDPSIDTEEEHIGPMAQDIEEVNPAAIKEDPETGYKEVDTGRLALMNAGAIAELARQMKEIQHG